jgi:uncharacterized protein (DUF433 family)
MANSSMPSARRLAARSAARFRQAGIQGVRVYAPHPYLLRQLFLQAFVQRGEVVYPTSCRWNTIGSIMSPMSVDGVITSDPDVQGGAVVFAGTRVPLKNLIDYLEAGDSLEVFLDDFPSVTREQAVAALELAQQALVSLASTH